MKVSAPVIGSDAPVAVARIHNEIEQAVRAAGLDHTFLRPYAFLQNLLNLAPTIRMVGFISGITGNAPMNRVDARDIADVAVVTLTTHRGRGPLVLTGAEAVSYPEVARRLTALGRPTRYVGLTRSEYRRALQRARLAPWLVDHLEEIQTLTSTHSERPTTTVADLTGRAPRGLDAFLVEHLGQFSSPHGWRERFAALPLRAAHRRDSSASAPERLSVG